MVGGVGGQTIQLLCAPHERRRPTDNRSKDPRAHNYPRWARSAIDVSEFGGGGGSRDFSRAAAKLEMSSRKGGRVVRRQCC